LDKHNSNYHFFKENIEPHYSNIVEFLAYGSGNRDLAYDIAQDTMEAAWKYINKIRSYDNIKAGLITIAKNKLKKHFSKSPLWIPLEEILDLSSTDKMLEEIVMSVETGEELKKLFRTLDKKYSQILIMHHYYGMSLKEISDIYGKNYNTVLSWHARAVKKLRDSCMKNEELRLSI
jgi:RNA polymerase sigma-70 factor (ECF subfamily)